MNHRKRILDKLLSTDHEVLYAETGDIDGIIRLEHKLLDYTVVINTESVLFENNEGEICRVPLNYYAVIGGMHVHKKDLSIERENMIQEIELKLKKDLEIVNVDDPYYEFLDGNKLAPENMLASKWDIKKVNIATDILKKYFDAISDKVETK